MNRLIAAGMTFLFLGSTALVGAEQQLKIKGPKQVGSSKGKGKKNFKSAGKPLASKNGQKGGKNYIELDSFSFGASNPANVGKSGGAGAGKASLSDINISKNPGPPAKITKANDSASPSLFQDAATGESLGGSNKGLGSPNNGGKGNPPGGNTTHNPVKITKSNDSASPSLFQNAATGESLGGKSNGLGSPGSKGKGKLPGINTTHKPIKINKSNGSASPSLFKSAIPGNSKTFQNNGQGSLINGGNGNSKGK
ncbi:MAG TPA: type VI secretion system tube protein Hcp [bacterium]|jgi:type VI protein secretion system component Hcp|nr:type VI secretion system tube protein Hcp [bacterium]